MIRLHYRIRIQSAFISTLLIFGSFHFLSGIESIAQTRTSVASIPYNLNRPQKSVSSPTLSKENWKSAHSQSPKKKSLQPIILARAQEEIPDDDFGFGDFGIDDLSLPDTGEDSGGWSPDTPANNLPSTGSNDGEVVDEYEDPVPFELDENGEGFDISRLLNPEEEEDFEEETSAPQIPALGGNTGSTSPDGWGELFPDEEVDHTGAKGMLEDFTPKERDIHEEIKRGMEERNKRLEQLGSPTRRDSVAPSPGPQDGWKPQDPSTQTPRPPVQPPEPQDPVRPSPEPKPEGISPQPDRRIAVRSRNEEPCVIGPPVAFWDQYGGGPEFAPISGFGVENPCAPLFAFDFAGYGKDPFSFSPIRCDSGRPYGWLFDDMSLFVGGTGFGGRTGALEEKSFGFYEGLNWSSCLSPRFGIGAQFGFRAVQRSIDFEGPDYEGVQWNSTTKGQIFLTMGLFKRAQSLPFQYGFVYDWMNDYKFKSDEDGFDSISLGQLRVEFSYAGSLGFTYGFRGAFGAQSSEPFGDSTLEVKATTHYLGFIEKRFAYGSILEFKAGGTREGNAILGVSFDQPIRDKFSIRSEFTYMLPKDDTSPLAINDRDGWEAMITFTFHPHGGAFQKACRPFRAMFDVASNGTLLPSFENR